MAVATPQQPSLPPATETECSAADKLRSTVVHLRLVSSIHASPAFSGLTNITEATGAVPMTDPSGSLNCDGGNPTSAGHATLARSLETLVVPEPANPALVVTG
jgi:hypothetical protein